MHKLEGRPKTKIFSLDFNPTDEFLACGSQFSDILIYNTMTGDLQAKCEPPSGDKMPVTGVKYLIHLIITNNKSLLDEDQKVQVENTLVF